MTEQGQKVAKSTERSSSELNLLETKKSSHDQTSFVGVAKFRKSNHKERTTKIFEQKHEDTRNYFVADHWTRIMLQNYHDTKLTDESLVNFQSYRKPPPKRATAFAKSKKPIEEPLNPKFYPVIAQIVEHSPYLTEKDHNNIEMIHAACVTGDDVFNSTYKHLLSFQADYKSKPGQYKVDPIDVELSRNIPRETMNRRRENEQLREADEAILRRNKYHIGTDKFIFSENFKVQLVPHCLTLEDPPCYPPKSAGRVRRLKAAVSRSREETAAGGEGRGAAGAVATVPSSSSSTLNNNKSSATAPKEDPFPYDAFADEELLEMLQRGDKREKENNNNNKNNDKREGQTSEGDGLGDSMHQHDREGGDVVWDGAIEEQGDKNNRDDNDDDHKRDRYKNNNDQGEGEVEVTRGDIVNCLVGMMSAELDGQTRGAGGARGRKNQLTSFTETLRSNKEVAEKAFRTAYKPLQAPGGRPQSASAALTASNPTIPTVTVNNKDNTNTNSGSRPLSAGRFGGISRASLITEPLLMTSVRPHSASEINRRISEQARARSIAQGGEYLISSRRSSGRRPLLNRSLPTAKWKEVLKNF